MVGANREGIFGAFDVTIDNFTRVASGFENKSDSFHLLPKKSMRVNRLNEFMDEVIMKLERGF